MAQTATKPQPDVAEQPVEGEVQAPEMSLDASRDWQAEQLRVLWEGRRFFARVGAIGLLVSTLIAFLIPKSYTSMAQLMPPDTQSPSGMAMMAALTARGGGAGLASVAGDLLGLQSSGALFIGVLRSQTAQERLIEEFGLQKVYGSKLITDARAKLDENTSISEDRKSGIISISVTDRDPKRAAAIANGYVNQLNALVAELSTSAAHRERVFLEERLKVAKRDLDDATNQLALFSSKNNTLDIQTEGKAMLDAAGTLAGEMVAAQSELEGLKQIYTDNNPRVRALNARVGELRKQLEKLSGTNAGAATSGDSSAAVSNGMPYPTIRSLPLLGAKYSDYYRRAKIQETVFELLTEQYELAKIEEAKETPSVKVLDPGQVPERKSFPSRSLIIFEGTFVVLAVSVAWVLGSNRWQAADPKDPRKVLAQEVARALKARIPWALRNGDAPDSSEQREGGLDGRRPPSSGPVDQ